ncbi:YkoF family thiamine/hydroxymethylpyrimidine-binding protein [Peptoclostridium acidaminophilum]|uniref:YkoF family thiamine/hydroxymethylpyrimidine-binding protein n=1 Tax=Peptoclostridium acidaminophilum TaxID=1731 RepID=UPI00130D5D08|nr:YkoF family thiamine/hydroxymethylpyrimidine-binding protein [Peptoclostridium acidaminophilum]
MEKITSCQISFTPIGSVEYLSEIRQVLDIIKDSGLEYDVGTISTVVIGGKDRVFKLISDIYEAMDDICNFTIDVKISNLCGCGK